MNFKQPLSYARAALGIMHGGRAFGGPIRACITLTNRCNIRCIHCYFYSPYLERPNLFRVRRARMMNLEYPDDQYLEQLQQLDFDRESAYDLIHELIGMGTRNFNFTGGEPFLSKHCMEFIRYVKHAGSSCIVNTNGTLLNKEIIDELIKIGLDELKITAMGGTHEAYMRTHQGVTSETFYRLRDNLLYIADRKAALGVRKPKVSLVMIVLLQNHDDVVNFAKFAGYVRSDRVHYRPIDDIEDAGLSKVVPTKENAFSVKEQLSEAKACLEYQGIAHNISYFSKVFGEQLDTSELYKLIPCYYGWLSVRIEADGMVYPCCRCYEPLGNIYERKFQEIWEGIAYNKVRKEAKQINKDKSPVSGCDCKSCTHFTANLRVYKYLHPLKGRARCIEQLCPTVPVNDR